MYRVTDPKFADHYQRSEARFRAEFLVQVLQEDCGVHYNAVRIRNVNFANPKDMFIHGMIDDSNGGTCASMPVMYVAVGRRLGYPMKLALAKQHVYCRWEGSAERFNIDASGTGGVDFPADEFYRKWPEPVSDDDLATGEFLRALTPSEEIALFMLNRGCVLQARRVFSDAVECYGASHRLMPCATGPKFAIASSLAGHPMPGQHLAPPQDPSIGWNTRRRGNDDPTSQAPAANGMSSFKQEPGNPREEDES